MAVLMLLGSTAGAADDPFVIDLSARADGGTAVTSHSADPARAPRMTLSAQPRRKIEIRWTVTEAATAKPAPNVTVHTFLERTAAAGPANAPKAGPNALYESAVGMDFSPGSRSTGQISIELPDAGDYLLRVETIGAARAVGREQAAVIALKVTP
jgi:hypothetical protein